MKLRTIQSRLLALGGVCLLAACTVNPPAEPVKAAQRNAAQEVVTIEEVYSLLGGQPSVTCAKATCTLTAPGRNTYRCTDGACARVNQDKRAD